jgi:hypothetical protein
MGSCRRRRRPLLEKREKWRTRLLEQAEALKKQMIADGYDASG